jgi:hypothetical protein
MDQQLKDQLDRHLGRVYQLIDNAKCSKFYRAFWLSSALRRLTTCEELIGEYEFTKKYRNIRCEDTTAGIPVPATKVGVGE